MRSRVFWSGLGCVLVLIMLRVAVSAQSPSSSSSKSVKSSQAGKSSTLDPGRVSAGVYRNSTFGFACRIPEGWVLRTYDLNAQKNGDPKSDGNHSQEKTDSGRVLLAAFSRPPEARGADINSSILIAAESAASYPGLKDAAQYFGPVTEVAKAQGFEVDEEPYEFAVGTKTLVRGDFEKDVGSRVMRQSTLVMLARGYVVSFTFIGGTEDEVGELVEGLSFRSPKPAK